MTATNHTITGMLIGLSVHQPVLAIVLAITSHFVLDSLPHYADPKKHGKSFVPMLATDSAVATVLLGSMLILQPQYWLLAIVCGIAAASPDLMWLPGWLREVLGKAQKPHNIVQRFHGKIQWGQKPYNYPYEIVWFIASLFLLVKVV